MTHALTVTAGVTMTSGVMMTDLEQWVAIYVLILAGLALVLYGVIVAGVMTALRMHHRKVHGELRR